MTCCIHVVTPSFNARDTIDRTVLGVVTQAGPLRIRYHVQDGGSTDGTFQRLLWWRDRIAARDFPLQCDSVDMTCDSAPDAGMYDAVVTGFGRMAAAPDDFMTWINADDLLLPGAMSIAALLHGQFHQDEVAWFGGNVAIIKDDCLVNVHDRKIPTEVLRRGLCDGTHWHFLQQEGVFFRKWLWDAVDPAGQIAPMRLAGDWNLWRLLAERATLVQVPLPLGAFRVRKDQLSALMRNAYLAEIETIMPAAARRDGLQALAAEGKVVRRRLVMDSTTMRAEISEEDARGMVAFHLDRQRDADTARAAQQAQTPAAVGPVARNVHAHDADWQFPAITEQHAYRRIMAGGGCPEGVVYVAYPWATLIDKLQSRTGNPDALLAAFREFCGTLPKTGQRVTVCQHILMRNYMHLFEMGGIAEIFWSHAALADRTDVRAIGIRPFPLYPVQVTEALDDPDGHDRPWLFSFIGAGANDWYMTSVRTWILERLAEDPRGLVVGRGNWHYNRIVYDHQIRGIAADAAALVDEAASVEFVRSLRQCVFSLCPSGSGPNSIRLWESLGAGAIPVILSDTYDPPGDRRLWDIAAVFCEESEAAVAALPERLAAIAADPARIAAMRHAMRQLWLLYGPDAFVTDLQQRMFDLAAHPLQLQDKRQDPGATFAFLRQIAAEAGPDLSKSSAELVLTSGTTGLILDPPGALKLFDPVCAHHPQDATELGATLTRARNALPPDSGTRLRYDSALRQARDTRDAPAHLRKTGPRVHLFGRHGHRTPLAYPPLAAQAERLHLTPDPAKADVLVTGFNIDLAENAAMLAPLVAQGTKIAVVSEEPLWDSVWSGGCLQRDRVIETVQGRLPYLFLNHQTSGIFDFDRIPVFLLTSDRFAARYQSLIGAVARLDAPTLLGRWRKAPVAVAFYAERREDERYDIGAPGDDLIGLSCYRSRVAAAVMGPEVLRVGKGWGGDGVRQDLPDWHLDKLAALAGRTRMLGAWENTHQRHYVSEKVFDAFAVGAIPICLAGSAHRVLDLVPEAAMLNTWGLNPLDAAAQINAFVPDRAFAGTYLDTAAALAQRFADPDAIVAERRRVMSTITREIEAML